MLPTFKPETLTSLPTTGPFSASFASGSYLEARAQRSRTQIINCLVEGNSIHSTEMARATQIDYEQKMRGPTGKPLDVGEIWSRVGQASAVFEADRQSRPG
jgi:hypothetical protein